MVRRLTGAVASLLTMLAGLWLILAPFALGTQPKNADWTHETFTNVWSGIGLGALGLIGVVSFTMALLQHLQTRGLIASRGAKNQAAGSSAPAEPAAVAPAADTPASTDLDKLIAPLVTALTTDLDQDHTTGQTSTNSSNPDGDTLATNNSTPSRPEPTTNPVPHPERKPSR